jgi:monoamine oxidase
MRPSPPSADVAVIGAGCAGLAAARVLSDAGRSAVVLEARTRHGGRVFTLHDPEWPLPVELGAEFLHGEAEEARAIARGAGLAVVELPDVHAWASNGRLRSMGEVWGRLAKLRRHIPDSGPDVSFAEFLRRRRANSDVRRMARLFVEGYYAAHLDRVSARSLKAGPDESEATSRQYRLADGYSGLVRGLRESLDSQRVDVRLGCVVSEIRWKKGEANIRYSAPPRGADRELRARAAIVTLPLGVLKAEPGQPGAVRFLPTPARLTKAVAGLEVSHACRISLRFKQAFWDEPDFFETRFPAARPGEPERIDFLHDADRPFPTWWTCSPWRVPILTAWAGGPRAEALTGLPSADLAHHALGALSGMLGLRRTWLEDRLDSWLTHDWSSDPFSRGAYSYVGIGGLQSQKALARPIDATLFFAGEALDAEQQGTVAGAIASGQRAGRQAVAALG